MNLIDFRHVEISLPNHGSEHASGALRGVSARVTSGEYVTVLGAAESGKTALLKLCNALLVPDAGSVSFRCVDSRAPGAEVEFRRGAAMVFSDPDGQIVGATVAEDAAFGPENLGLPPEEVRERVHSSLRAVGLDEKADCAVHLLTPSEKLKLALAGALALRPQCLLIDDPAGLSLEEKEEFRRLLRALNRIMGIAVLHASSDPDDAAGADRVVLLEKGRIVLDGPPSLVLGASRWPNSATRVPTPAPMPEATKLPGLFAGRYLPGASVLHRSDPRTKLVLALFLMAAAFSLATPAALLLLLAAALGLGAACGRPLGDSFKSLRPIFWLALVAAAAHLVTADGTPLSDRGALSHITREGALSSALMLLRLLLLAGCASLLTVTTTPAALGEALARVLKPLEKLGLPVSQLATMLQLSLRLLPVIFEEGERLFRARPARGEGAGFVQRIASLPPLMIPLFASVARRGETMAEAMESRCYRGPAGRTRMVPLAFSAADLKSVMLFSGFMVAAVCLEFLNR